MSLKVMIDLQNKTKPRKGKAEKYWFENKSIGLEMKLYHRIYIPLEEFDSGLEYVDQPEKTEIVIEWLFLNLSNPDDLDRIKITSIEYTKAECSIYLGGVHNPCEVVKFNFSKIRENEYMVDGKLLVDFEESGVGRKEFYKFQTKVLYCK